MDDLCAGKIEMTPHYCYLHSNNDPFLIFGPVKAEVLSISRAQRLKTDRY